MAEEGGTFSFALDDDKIFFGREAKDAKGQVRFLTEILDDFRRFVDEIWRF